MKAVAIILLSLLVYNCTHHQPKEQTKTNTPSDSLMIETVEINDSTKFANYNVITDTAWFYAGPDENKISAAYLTKNHHLLICEKRGEFGYAVKLSDSIEVLGWLKMKCLEEVFFTPPKVEGSRPPE